MNKYIKFILLALVTALILHLILVGFYIYNRDSRSSGKAEEPKSIIKLEPKQGENYKKVIKIPNPGD
jgi:uncharacterized membrane protein